MIKLDLHCSSISADGDFTPSSALIQTDFQFIKASDNVTPVAFTGFANVGNGSYLFYGFAADNIGTQVRVKISGTFKDGFGTFSVFPDEKEPAGIQYIRDNFVDISTDQAAIDGNKTFVKKIKYSTNLTINNDLELIHKKFAADNFINVLNQPVFFHMSDNMLIVDANTTLGADAHHYTTIQAAINFAQAVATVGSQWHIYIIPYKDRTVGYGEGLTLYSYVHLIGLGKVRINGSLTGINGLQKLENIHLQKTGNLTLTGLFAENCNIYCTSAMTVENLILINCGLYANSFVNNGNNTFYGACHSNLLTTGATDKGTVLTLGEAGTIIPY